MPSDCSCNCLDGCPVCRAEGERRKVVALDLLKLRRKALVRHAQRALLELLLDESLASIAESWVTADDVRYLVELPPDIDPKVFGAVPSGLAKAGIIRPEGSIKTCRPEGHARPITLWVATNRAVAERWLATHPELPDPSDGERQCPLFLSHENATPTGDAAGAAM